VRKIINNEQTKNKELCFEENFWTGKKTIIYNGQVLTKIKTNVYQYSDEQTTEQFVIKGNTITGLAIQMFGNSVVISRKLLWYEIVMSVMVFIPSLYFGAIGGALGGGLGFTNLTIIKNIDKWWLKLIVSIQFTLVSLLLSYIFVRLIFKL